MRRKEHRILIGLFLVVFCVAANVLHVVIPDKTFSSSENRTLAQKPVLTKDNIADGSFYSDLDDYYSDQFFARDGWIYLNFLAKKIFGGSSESGGVYIGRDGQLFQSPSIPDREANKRTVNAMNVFSQQYPEVNQVVVVVPGAAMVMGNWLPQGAPIRNQLVDISQFESGLASTFTIIDAAEALRSEQAEGLYYKTDHHWTSEGARCVFEKTASALGIYTLTQYAPYIVTENFRGTLASRSGDYSPKDTIRIYEPIGTTVRYYVNYPDSQKKSTSIFVSEKLEEKDQYQVFFGGNHPLVEIHTTADNGRNLLVFKDSYANSFIQFLTPYFSKIIMIDPRYYYESIASAMQSYQITDVLYLYSADTLLTDTNLADTLETLGTMEETSAEGSAL